MTSVASGRAHTPPSSVISDGKNSIERWHSFFRTDNSSMTQQKKRLHWMSKFTHIALVNYLRFRKVYPYETFVKQRFGTFTFYGLNKKNERGEKLSDTIREISSFINREALKALRFQLFHSSEKPDEIGEELHFQFYYGRDQRVELNFGDGKTIAFDMADCDYEQFLHSFGDALGKIRAYCLFLTPLPDDCEKRFRTSFYKKVPQETMGDLFKIASHNNYYAPDIKLEEIGKVGLNEGAAAGAILRTCYLTDEAKIRVEQKLENEIQSQIMQIFGHPGSDTLETPRQLYGDDQMYNSSVAGSELPPLIEQAEIPVPDEDHSVIDELFHEPSANPTTPQVSEDDIQILDVKSPTPLAAASIQSPFSGDTESVASLEVIFSPYLRQPLIHETTHIIDNPPSSPSNNGQSDNGQSDNESNKRDGNDEGSVTSSAQPKKKASKPIQAVRRSTRNTKAAVYAEMDSSDSSSEEDPHKDRRKRAPVKRKSNRSQIMEASKQPQAAKRPRRTIK